jgi:hypothetical protein
MKVHNFAAHDIMMKHKIVDYDHAAKMGRKKKTKQRAGKKVHQLDYFYIYFFRAPAVLLVPIDFERNVVGSGNKVFLAKQQRLERSCCKPLCAASHILAK